MNPSGSEPLHSIETRAGMIAPSSGEVTNWTDGAAFAGAADALPAGQARTAIIVQKTAGAIARERHRKDFERPGWVTIGNRAITHLLEASPSEDCP